MKRVILIAVFIFAALSSCQISMADDSTLVVAAKDAYIAKLSATTNYGNEATLSVYDDNTSTGRYRSVIDFPIDNLAANTCDSGFLYIKRYGGGATNMGYYVYGLRREWIEDSVTWNDARDDISWGAAGADNTSSDRYDTKLDSALCQDSITYGGVTGFYKLDITDYLQLCDNGDTGNFHGVLISVKQASASYTYFFFHSAEATTESNRPRLVYFYSSGGGEEEPLSRRRRNTIINSGGPK